MKVRMLMQVTGTRNDVPWPGPGEVLDLPEDEARNYINQGYAEAAGEIVEPNKEQPVENRPVVEREPLGQAQTAKGQEPTKAPQAKEAPKK